MGIMKNVVEVKDVYFAYEEDNDALKGVSFAVEKGTYTTILGHNGSGKSTIAKLISGLLVARSGEILIDGEILNERSIESIRRKLGIVFQNPDNQFIASSVREDIAFGLENYCVDPEKMDAIIERYAALVDMKDKLEKEPTNLSGGQKQRVAIAGVLAMQPQIIIFDEATSMLDPKGKEEIKKTIHDLHSDRALTIISITHDIEEALNSDYVIVLNDGKLYKSGRPEDIFKDKEGIEAIGLDIPFTYKVAFALRGKGIMIRDVAKIEDLAEEIWRSSLKN